MHPDDLKKVWLCCECGRGFAFNSDVEDHKQQFGHSKMMLYDLQTGHKKSPPVFIRGRTSFDFRLDCMVSKIVIEYEYYPSSDKIRYIDVRYKDKRLKFKVESNTEVMKNIDNYLRKLLTRKISARP